MTWDQEWQEIKAGARERESASMQLNQVDSGHGGGGAPDLASSPARKRAAGNAIRDHLVPDVRRHGNDAEDGTAVAVKEFGARDGDGWDTAAALKKAHVTWEKQVKTLIDRLVFEQNGLLKTGTDLRSTDLGVASSLRLKSNIDSL